MQKTFTTQIERDANTVFDVIADIETYPAWLDVVTDVKRTDAGDDDEAWLVTLRASVGPLARSKRLRMVRTVHDAGPKLATVRFERSELDGRDHAPWTMDGTVMADGPTTSTASMSLSYGGAMWSGLLDGVLDVAAERATKRLDDYVMKLAPGAQADS